MKKNKLDDSSSTNLLSSLGEEHVSLKRNGRFTAYGRVWAPRLRSEDGALPKLSPLSERNCLPTSQCRRDVVYGHQNILEVWIDKPRNLHAT